MANGRCSKCKIILTQENSCPSVFKRGYGLCRPCDSYRNREVYGRDHKRIRGNYGRWYGKKGWEARYFKKYGVPVEEFHKKLIFQSGRCDMCNRPMVRPCQDHNHETGQLRGLLCSFCNGLLGRVCENEDTLLGAVAYLRKFKGDDMTVH